MAIKLLRMTARGRSQTNIAGSKFKRPYNGEVCYCSDLDLVPKEGYYAVNNGQIDPTKPLKDVREGSNIRFLE